MERIAVFPGSFDPVTRGHVSIVLRAIPLFTKIIVAIGENGDKRNYFPIEKRLAWLKQVFHDRPEIEVKSYAGLTVEFCQRENAGYILRGLRTSADFEFERGIGQVNRLINNKIESVFLLTLPEYSAISSSIVRDIIRNGGNPKPFLPEGIQI